MVANDSDVPTSPIDGGSDSNMQHVSGYELTVRTDGLSQPDAERFEALAVAVHACLAGLADHWNCPPVRVEAVVTSDFLGQLQATLAEAGHEEAKGFTTERAGGVVAAKNIALNADESLVRVIFDAEIVASSDAPEAQAWAIFLIAHELTHPLLGQLRRASGVLEGVTFPSLTPTAMARSICRVAADEFRVDMVANAVLMAMVSRNVDGDPPTPMRFGELTERGYGAQVVEALDALIWPGLPREVRRYQEHHIDMETMWDHVVGIAGQVFTLLAHAEAEARSLEMAGPLEMECADHPGTIHLLMEAWGPFVTALLDQPLVPELAEWRALECHLLDVGEEAVRRLWSRLGLDARDEQPEGQFYLAVSTPANETEWLRED